MSSIKILELEGVTFAYQKNQDVLRGLTFSIEKGKRVALLGPNGSGKSTSFKIISTQVKGWTGNVKVAAWDLRKDPVQVRKRLGVCFQNPSLDKILTAEENLFLQGKVMGVDHSSVRKEVAELAATLKVDYLKKRVAELSGGQARRVEIMKAFLGNPSLLLLDEPTNGLDPQARKDFWAEVDALSQRKSCSVVVTTHLIEEAEVCDELVFISEGSCVAQGRPQELRRSLGFEILHLEAPELREKKKHIDTQLRAGEKSEIFGDSLRISTQRPAELFEAIRGLWATEIQRIEWAKPSLADVYFEKTGRAFQ